MARAQEDLTHAVIVTVCGAEPLAPADAVAEVLAIRLGIEACSLVLCQASNSSYLLVLPDVGLVERLMDQQLPPPLACVHSPVQEVESVGRCLGTIHGMVGQC